MPAMLQAQLCQMLLTGCCVFYLAWWVVFFCPAVRKPKKGSALWNAGALSLVVAAVLGIAGVVFGVRAVAELNAVAVGPVPAGAIGLCGLAAYAVLVAVTVRLFHRPVTTELILFTGWLTLQLCLLDAVCWAQAAPAALCYALVAVAVLVFAACLACYVWWYTARQDKQRAFWIGAIPLVLVAAAGLAFAFLL